MHTVSKPELISVENLKEKNAKPSKKEKNIYYQVVSLGGVNVKVG